MKKTLTAAGCTLIAALSGLSITHAAGFNDISVIPAAALVPSARQALSPLPVVHGFNQKSHDAGAAPTISGSTGPVAAEITGAYCSLAPRFGFNDGVSSASC